MTATATALQPDILAALDRDIDIRVLYWHNGGGWTAKCLEYDVEATGDEWFGSDGPTIADQLRTIALVDALEGVVPLSRVPKAAPAYWRAYAVDAVDIVDIDGELPIVWSARATVNLVD